MPVLLMPVEEAKLLVGSAMEQLTPLFVIDLGKILGC